MISFPDPDADSPTVCPGSVLEDVNPLPLSEIDAAIGDRDVLASSGHCRPEMRGHVVGSFSGVCVGAVPLRCDLLHPILQVVANR